MRQSGKIENYNFRDYARRRVRVGFDEKRALVGTALEAELSEGGEQLKMLQR